MKYFSTSKKIWSLIILLLQVIIIHAQESQVLRYNINWLPIKEESQVLLMSENSVHNDAQPSIHSFFSTIPFKNVEILSSNLIVGSSEIIDITDTYIKNQVTDKDYIFYVNNNEKRNNYELHLYLNPVRKTQDGKIERILSFSIEIKYKSLNNNGLRNPESTFTSVLSTGDIYKLSVNQTGIHKIDKTFLESKLGINVANINPKKIKIFGNRGGTIPESNSQLRTDDLEELSIFIAGEEDQKFDNNDFILFYAEGADIWQYNEINNSFNFDKNIYDDLNYYYIKIDNQDGIRIQKSNTESSPALETSSYFDMRQRMEDEKINLLGNFSATEGTGKDWYGDGFNSSLREKNYSSRFDFTGLDNSKPVEIEMVFAGRSRVSSNIIFGIGSKNLSKNISSVNDLNFESLYARRVMIKESVLITEQNPIVKLNYPSVSAESQGWIDYIQIVNSSVLNLTNSQLAFRNRALKNSAIAAFDLKNYNNQVIWDVTDVYHPTLMEVSNNQIKFRTGGKVKEFISHNNLTGAYEPAALGKIANQNLHGMKDEDMILVYHPKFKDQALRLADHRRKHSNIKVIAAETNEIYNEFSSGKADPGAIRDMARLLLSRNPNFKYLLLFGDGSYDYKGIVKDIPAENFVPVYETDESLDPIDGFPSDDFYGLLGDNEGVNLVGGLDIYVGRLPVKTAEEAQVVVDKIIHYDTAPSTLGDWRLQNGFVADDEDSNTHLRDIDEIANLDEVRHPLYNQQKVYSDAFKQVSTSGEKRFPDANKIINENLFKGQLSLTYLGHGGPLGWAQERILTVSDIQNWNNYNSLTVLVTATCSFGAYDDPSIISPAEYAILNPKGGAVALMTTTRAVYTNSNKQLTDAAHELMYKKINGKAPTMGYILSEGKNKYSGDFFRINSRKFSLLGDPSQQIALPKLNIITEQINGKNALTTTDTINALEKVTIQGYISDEAGNPVTSFNGTIFPTVFDKKSTLQTLSNDEGSPKFNFTVFKNIIFKGSATVSGGKWSFSFWVPKNINYNYGKGRISYYATDGNALDAGGLYSNLTVGGTSTQLIVDDQGPQMGTFMNDESFVSGGMTNSDPVLLLNLTDDFGINVTGNAIGQDITAVLDGNSKNVFILNEFYEAQKDNFTSGKVRFPLTNLEKGNHFIVAKAWDISGNSTEKRIDFTVAEGNDNGLKRVYNYPNPFTSNTSFQFEHDLSNTELDVTVNIYTITGKLIKSITQTKYSSGFRVNDISWNGNDDFEAGLARGIYLYKINVHSKELNLTRESNFEKLIKL